MNKNVKVIAPMGLLLIPQLMNVLKIAQISIGVMKQIMYVNHVQQTVLLALPTI